VPTGSLRKVGLGGELGVNSGLINKTTKGLTIETNLRIYDNVETAKSASFNSFIHQSIRQLTHHLQI
jgi:hypothetical protein